MSSSSPVFTANWSCTPADCQPFFVQDSAAARSAWLQLQEQARRQVMAKSLQLHSYPHPLHGPAEETLATDCLWLGNTDAQRLVVLISGTHGIEGYAGSAIQRFLLTQLLAKPEQPGSTAILFVHAITPWGFAWYRRCDENGIDLNRHFVDFSAPPANPQYPQVRPWLFEPEFERRARGLSALAAQLGRRDYEVALSGGQYSDPAGPFYGGSEPNHGYRVTMDLFRRFQLADRDLVVLDLHTGLGPWGYGELICDHPPGSAGAAAARQLFGAAVAEPALGTSASVPKTGLADYAWHEVMNTRSCYLTLEFGSYSTDSLFDCLIEDHQFWARQPSGKTMPESAQAAWQPHRLRLLEHFCPADPWWRHSIILRSQQVLQQAIAGQP